MTLADFVAIIGSLGTVSGIILYFLNKRLNTATTVASVTKTNKEIEQIEQDIETKYAIQVKKWLDDLREIRDKHDAEIAVKVAELKVCHDENAKLTEALSELQKDSSILSRAFRKLIISLEIPYWERTPEGEVTYVNGAWINLCGVTAEEATGKEWFDIITPEYRAPIEILWKSKLADQIDGAISYDIENPTTKEIIHVKSIYTIVIGRDGETEKVLGVLVKL